MGKNKLRKFSEMETIDFVFQYPYAVLEKEPFPLRGKWHEDFFGNSNPIVLELGCGKGEYTVGLARRFPDKNFIGIDIKGARMWSGATQARREGLKNVAFLRTNIELLPAFFAPGEVAEIWITFPDPQMKKVRKRLTSTRFINLYQEVAAPGAILHLKTDSPFLYTYTHALAALNNFETLVDTDDLYGAGAGDLYGSAIGDGNTPFGAMTADILGIRTYYEQQWLSRGLTIKYISFRLPTAPQLAEPDIEIPLDTYRSFSRDYLSRMPKQSADTAEQR